MEKYFEIIEDDVVNLTIESKRHVLHRIVCVKDFTVNLLCTITPINIKAGQKGGYVAGELSEIKNSWVDYNSFVINSYLENSYIEKKSCVINSDIKNSHISHCTIDNNSVIRDSHFASSTIKGALLSNVVTSFNNSDERSMFFNCNIRNASFRERANITNQVDFITFSNVGSRCDTLTAYRTTKDGIRIMVGCFYGSIDEFEYQVKSVHKNNPLVLEEYLHILEVIKIRLERIHSIVHEDRDLTYELMPSSEVFGVEPADPESFAAHEPCSEDSDVEPVEAEELRPEGYSGL